MSSTTWDDVVKESPTGGDFLKADDKERLYETQEPFAIIGAKPKVESTFGPQTYFTVKLASDPDNLRTLTLSHNDYRDGVATVAARKIEETGQPIGPCYLRKFATKGGNNAWEISGQPLDPPPGKSAARSGDTPDFLR